MRKLFALILVSILSLISVSAQVNWTKYPSNPVFTPGPAFYDIVAVGQPSVIMVDDTFRMYYSAVGGDMKCRIGYAWSLDGINWTKHTDMVINTGFSGAWDSEWLDTPEIVKVDSGYLCYFYGDSIGYDTSLTHNEGATHSAIGVAYSPDGINWTKSPANPVFTRGNYGEWDGTWVESPAVLRDENTGELMMWYNGVDTTTWKIQIGLATSSDGINWTKYAGNPVLQDGNWGEYDDMWLGTPAVIYKTDHFEMWYSSAASADYNTATHKFDTLRICFAYSDDGVNWNKYAHNPLFNTGTTPYDSLIEHGGPWAPDVVYIPDSSTYYLWYEAAGGFLLATADSSFVYVGEDENEMKNSVSIYPNPSTDKIIIETNNILEYEWSVLLYDLNGRIVSRNEKISNKSFLIETKGLKKGVYIISIELNNKFYFEKVIFQ
ncbi:MAG: T9SS type A sorting domain-containing protein [Bacteroidales bacterium]|nr:T9SS type A sorting domain-containing protein [Bacteroidales bacterium]